MIGLGKSISHTAASINYGWNEEKEAVIVLRNNISGDSPQEITSEFRFIQKQNCRCKRNTLSFVLSPTIEDGEHLNDKQLSKIAHAFVNEMELSEHQAIAFVHKDKNHKHIHLYCNRINFKGKAYNDSYIGFKTQKMTRAIALRYGLQTVENVQKVKKESSKKIRSEIHEIHQRVLLQMGIFTLDDYIKRMRSNAVHFEQSVNKQGKVQGYRVSFGVHNFKASEIHRSMSKPNLEKTLTELKTKASIRNEQTRKNYRITR